MTFLSQQEHSRSLRDRLAAVDPEMSTELGTFTRKMIDAVAEEMAMASIDVQVQNYLFDVDSYSGSDLDAYVSQFGFARTSPNAATGYVTVSRYDASRALVLSPGTQFYKPPTGSTVGVFFQCLTYVQLDEGVTSLDVPVVAVLSGTQGNVSANTVIGVAGESKGVNITNELPMTGGRELESDEALRTRFKETVFRNVAGTKDQYLGLALAHALVSRAVLVGQSSTFSEMLTMGGDTTQVATSTNTSAASVIDDVNLLWLRNADTGEYYVQGVDYTAVVTAMPPVINGLSASVVDESDGLFLYGTTPVEVARGGTTSPISSVTVKDMNDVVMTITTDYTLDLANGTVARVAGGGLDDGEQVQVSYSYFRIPDDTTVLLDYNYLSTLNRGVGRNVELFIDGEDYESVQEERYLSLSSLPLMNAVTGTWVRSDGSTPTATNYLSQLSFQPARTLPDSISFPDGVVLNEGTDYWLVHDTSVLRGSTRARSGIEWKVASVTAIDNKPYTIDFTYNRAVAAVQAIINEATPITVDCLVHEASRRYFKPYLEVIYDFFPRGDVDAALEDALTSLMDSTQFGGVIQFSDVESVAHSIEGVDAVRISATGIKEYGAEGNLIATRTEDIMLAANEIPVLYGVDITSRTQEVW